MTPATADLCGIMPKKDVAYLLLEAAAIHESHHLERDNGPPHHRLYGVEDITRSMRHFHPLGYGKKLDTTDFQRSLETPVTP